MGRKLTFNARVGFPAHSLSPREHQALLHAEREGAPFVAYRDHLGDLRIVPLPTDRHTRIGRTADNDVVLPDDPEVSRTHAQLTPGGGGFTLVDDGMSRNGSFVNGEQVVRHQRLQDHDLVRIGATSMLFRNPGVVMAESTVVAEQRQPTRLTEAERRVLLELCRPVLEPGVVVTPASNQEIAEILFLAPASVKSHVRVLFQKLGVDDLPQNRKRAELARRAIELGLITARDR